MLELQVSGMSCSHCVNAITKSVHKQDPQAKVDVDLAKQIVRVETGAARDKIVVAVEDAGYEVKA